MSVYQIHGKKKKTVFFSDRRVCIATRHIFILYLPLVVILNKLTTYFCVTIYFKLNNTDDKTVKI